jgi:hypothetical protein
VGAIVANAMMAIYPYKHEGLWVFDDDRAGLVREPFVFGVPEMIDALAGAIPNAETGFRLLFSANPFPGLQEELVWVRGEYDGNWYRWPKHGSEGWLCPALLKYFERAPEKIYVRFESKH